MPPSDGRKLKLCFVPLTRQQQQRQQQQQQQQQQNNEAFIGSEKR
jgi:hypothetical protein